MLNKRVVFPSVFFFLAALLTLFVTEHGIYLFIAKLILLASLIILVAEASGVSIGNLLLLGVSILLVLVMAEVFVRILFDDITTTGDNSSYFARKWKETNKPSVNSLGYREREISVQKPAGVYRIAVVGDSLTYGQGIAEQDRFSRLMERRLNGGKISYQVYNFGIPGAETIDHIRFLEDVFKIDPDFVLLQWYTNDVEGHDKSGRESYYRLIPSDYLTGILHKNSALYYVVNNQWHALQSQLGLIGPYGDSMNARFGDINSENSQRAIHELNEFITRVKDKNIPLGIVMFPDFVLTEGGVEKYPFDFLFDRVIDACHKYDIKCIDLRPAYAKENPKELWVNIFDGHPSMLANKIAADVIMQTFINDWGNSTKLQTNL